jgi:glycosyltransferase involved in cell wall biosynthesis
VKKARKPLNCSGQSCCDFAGEIKSAAAAEHSTAKSYTHTIRILRILFITHGDLSKASSRVRAFWIGEELQKQGVCCDYLWPQNRWATLACLPKLKHYDVIIFQKTYGRYHHCLQAVAKRLGKRTFIDIDDAPSLNNEPHTMRRVAAMMSAADGVFVGCHNLLDYATPYNSNTQLIPSSIKLENYPLKDPTPTPVGTPICLGWIGNGAYYAEDLISILAAPMTALAARYPIKLKIVGACGNPRLDQVFAAIEGLEYQGIDRIDWSDPQAVVAQIHSFDIGLYPLVENPVNHFKCGFKALEYMACGLPVVSSDVTINAEIVTHAKNGYIASNTNDWLEALTLLIESTELRMKLGLLGRIKVKEVYSTAYAASLTLKNLSAEKIK